MDWLDLLAVQGTLESSPTPQFKSINSSVLSFIYSPTLKSIHDYWKNHSLEAETLVLWPLDAKSWLIWKDPDAKKDLRAGGEGDDKGWDGWVASLTQWTWVWVNSGSQWWTGSPGVLQFMGSQGAGLDWATELNWTDKMDLFGKVKSLLFNILSRLVKTFLPRSNHFLISCLQSQYAVILEPQKIKSDTISTVSLSICHEVMGPVAVILVFWMLSFKPTFSLSSFTFIKRLFSFSSLYAIRVVSSAYLRLLTFLPAILIPACASSSPAFLMMYSAYKLNKQGDNIRPWRTPFPIWNQSVVPCPVLTVASWPAYRFTQEAG